MNYFQPRSWLQVPFRSLELLTIFRRAFPSNFFHVLPLSDIVSKTFEEVLASRSVIATFDREILREQSTTVFLHQDDDYSLKRFLGILVRTSHLPQPPSCRVLLTWCWTRPTTYFPFSKPNIWSNSASASRDPKPGTKTA